MRLESRRIVSTRAVELYLTATADPAGDPACEAGRMFDAIQSTLGETQAPWSDSPSGVRRGTRACVQRVFVPDGCLDAYLQAWRAAEGRSQTDCVCTWLRAGPSAAGGVQAHAIAGPGEWAPLRDGSGATAGWACRNGATRWALAGGLWLPPAGDDVSTTREAFAAAEGLLAQAGMGLGDVARTWFFLDDILGWYGQFNTGRNEVFRQRGLLSAPLGVAGGGGPVEPPPVGPSPRAGGPNVPASTGIGVSPAGGGRLAMELIAVRGEEGCILRCPAAGRQHCAYDYGSAFARASEAATPAGRTVFVSGTAAIDEQGRTCFLGDAPGQIRMTLGNVLAVLSDMRCSPQDVVQAIAYCKTPAVAARFAELRMGSNSSHAGPAASPAPATFQVPAWPWVVAVCDVCRDDLLFEVEATACRPADPPG